ncbi:SDR family oxidoreductase [Pectinatus haikarae]|uniref:2-deoxy-D-gluconate 3-dehydrogenase n=1 Tax=Pectinatus haikarae TaxID=349096 RepID=A0ABT9YAB3_9FIRM|nr:SDR family oxidoreductase [Pectinatus haikarae]MDQ0204044.1 2-deoxy-D-gluconate 3-dehydrogenase [Pectinatus haikarae]
MSILNMFDLSGKKAIVTGGGRGLGKGMAEGLCEAGAEVVLIGSSDSVLKTADEFVGKSYKAFGLQGNLSEEDRIPLIFERALTLLNGKIDILINNAGLQSRHKCEEFPLSDWHSVMQVNLNAVFSLCQLAGKKMIEEGYGKIINMASMLSFFGGFTVPAYAASKGGVAQLTKALANEWSKKNVHVNAIAPGYMDTEMNINLVNDAERNGEILNRIPIGRWGTPEDMKGLAVFLASPASDYINGAIIPIDGGYLGK